MGIISVRRKASSYTRKHNTRRRQTFMSEIRIKYLSVLTVKTRDADCEAAVLSMELRKYLNIG